MGKKNSVSAFERYTNSGKYGDALKRYGVEGIRSGKPGGDSGYEPRTAEDVDRELADKANKDYDTRRTMEAQAMAGKGKAEKYAKNGFNNVTDVLKANNMMSRWHKNQGNGGDFSSTSDFAGLTYNSVERDRAKQTAAYDETYAKTTDLNDLKDKLMAQATEKAASPTPIEPSDRMAAVEDRLESAASNRPPSLYSKNNTDPAKADDQKDAARSFLTDFTADVREGANIRSDIATGVSNAAKHVRDTYGR